MAKVNQKECTKPKSCKLVERTITVANAKTAGRSVKKAFTFMSKPSCCGTPRYDKPTKAQVDVRNSIGAIGEACAGVGSIGGKNGMSAARAKCVKQHSKLYFPS